MIKKLIPIVAIAFLLNACSKKINQSQVLKDLEEIASDKYEGRATGTKGAEMAAKFIKDRYTSLGLQAFTKNFEMPFSFNNKGEEVKGKNIVAYIKGQTDKVIVISAHYDHLGVKNGLIYNGADDDASGIAAILSYAEYFSKNKPVHTLVFAAFDAEEMGLMGSKKFVEKPPVAARDIIMNINLDMIGQNDKNELYACGTYHYPQLKQYILSKNNKPQIILGHDDPKLGHNDWTNQSDHFSFHQKNIPFIYFGVEDHKDYHQATDDYENINQIFYTHSVNTILSIIKNIDEKISYKTLFNDSKMMK